jgi:hypothetical protein
VRPDDPRETADAIVRLTTDADLRVRLSTTAREVSADYSEETTVKDSIAILHQVMGSIRRG